MISPERQDALQTAWLRLLEQSKVPPVDALPIFDLLVAAYNAPERHYHNLEHLHEMFRVASRLANATSDPVAVQLAIWFHDAVYDSRANDNEARSAELAVDLLGAVGVSRSVVEKVVRLVQATAHLAPLESPPDRETALLLDADLAILGASEERYQRYASDIRREYAWLGDHEYQTGRARVLQRLLARPRLYHHSVLFEEGEQRARENMQQELAGLATPGE